MSDERYPNDAANTAKIVELAQEDGWIYSEDENGHIVLVSQCRVFWPESKMQSDWIDYIQDLSKSDYDRVMDETRGGWPPTKEWVDAYNARSPAR